MDELLCVRVGLWREPGGSTNPVVKLLAGSPSVVQCVSTSCAMRQSMPYVFQVCVFSRSPALVTGTGLARFVFGRGAHCLVRDCSLAGVGGEAHLTAPLMVRHTCLQSGVAPPNIAVSGSFG